MKYIAKLDEDKVYSCQMLHAKIYIFHDKHSIVTSANLTTSGFRKNLEYGVYISNINLVNKTVEDFKLICNSESTGRIDNNKIIHIENILKSLPVYQDVNLKKYNQYNEVDTIVDITNMQDVKKLKGCPFQFFKELLKWTSLDLSNKKIRFAWYMEITSSIDVLKLKQIRINYNTT